MSHHQDKNWKHTVADHKMRQEDMIAHAAVEVLMESGATGLTMKAIAEAAKVSRQTLYSYFPDVEAVLVRIAEQSASMEDHIHEVLKDADSATERLKLLVKAGLMHPHPKGVDMRTIASMLPAVASEGLEKRAHQSFARITRILEEGKSAGAFRTDLVPEIDSHLIYGIIAAASEVTAHDDGRAVLEATTRTVLAAVDALDE